MENNQFENTHDTLSEAELKSEGARERAAAAAQRTADKVGSQIRNFAGRIREGGPRVESKIHDTTSRLADTLERGASYFTERKYEDTTRKITDAIRRNPARSLLIGLAAGVLLAIKRRR
jgi:hypothetical protein